MKWPKIYDRARPGYPDALVQTIVDVTGLPDNARLLEIGVGTGKATLPFAQRGYRLHGLEPGHNLSASPPTNLQPTPTSHWKTFALRFGRLPQTAFYLLLSAQAFHWIAPEVRFSKSAAALKEGGWLALFWNENMADSSGLFAQIQAAYQTFAPDIARVVNNASHADVIAKRAHDIQECGLFQNLTTYEYPWSQSYTTHQYLDLLDTYSDHRLLPDEAKRLLYEQIAQAINAQGGSIVKSYVAVLYLAQKRFGSTD